jgi:hypothetical protein
VSAAGNHPERLGDLRSKANVDPKYTKDARFDSLAADPDHGGKQNPNSLQEAVVGLEAESRGLLPAPLERGPKGIEFYDGEGHPWDVKKPPSPPAGAKWRFNVRRTAESIRDQVRVQVPNKLTGALEPVRVLMDSSFMTPADHGALWTALRAELSASELNLIIELNTVPAKDLP